MDFFSVSVYFSTKEINYVTVGYEKKDIEKLELLEILRLICKERLKSQCDLV